jgi:hypothetical protein
MKKIIKILQSHTEPLIIEDENDSDLNEYISELSKLLSIGNISILETSSASVIIRPHQITSIVVTEEGKPKRKYTKKKVVKKENIQEDIVTDG